METSEPKLVNPLLSIIVVSKYDYMITVMMKTFIKKNVFNNHEVYIVLKLKKVNEVGKNVSENIRRLVL